MNRVLMYTDGSHRPDHVGGWSCLIIHDGRWTLLCDRVTDTTINRMELTAIYRGLAWLIEPSQVTIISDSQYAVNCVNTWIRSWSQQNWKTREGKPVSNQDLLMAIAQLLNKHKVTAQWIKAHTKRDGCDYLGNDCVDWFAQHKSSRINK